MMANKKEFTRGFVLILCFLVILGIMFSPIFSGKNALEFSDDLYNSISKESAYYIPAAKKGIEPISGETVDIVLNVDAAQAENTALLYRAAGASAAVENDSLRVSGDLGAVLSACLEDADAMFANNGEALSSKYNLDARLALFNWWSACQAMDKALSKQKQFKLAKAVDLVKKKAVEPAYNYYGIEPQKITERLGIVLFSLVFYVIYTLWYGFSIMFMFEGWGMQLEH